MCMAGVLRSRPDRASDLIQDQLKKSSATDALFSEPVYSTINQPPKEARDSYRSPIAGGSMPLVQEKVMQEWQRKDLMHRAHVSYKCTPKKKNKRTYAYNQGIQIRNASVTAWVHEPALPARQLLPTDTLNLRQVPRYLWSIHQTNRSKKFCSQEGQAHLWDPWRGLAMLRIHQMRLQALDDVH